MPSPSAPASGGASNIRDSTGSTDSLRAAPRTVRAAVSHGAKGAAGAPAPTAVKGALESPPARGIATRRVPVGNTWGAAGGRTSGFD